MVCRLLCRLLFLLNVFLFLRRFKERSSSNLATFQLEVGVVDWNCSICVCSTAAVAQTKPNKPSQMMLTYIRSSSASQTGGVLPIEVSWLVGDGISSQHCCPKQTATPTQRVSNNNHGHNLAIASCIIYLFFLFLFYCTYTCLKIGFCHLTMQFASIKNRDDLKKLYKILLRYTIMSTVS